MHIFIFFSIILIYWIVYFIGYWWPKNFIEYGNWSRGFFRYSADPLGTVEITYWQIFGHIFCLEKHKVKDLD